MASLIGAGASILGGIVGGKGASKAAKAQAQAQQQALAQQQAQFQQTRQDNMPFLQAGYGALGQTQDALGLNGAGQQQAFYDMIKASPAFQALYNTGQDTVLQNAAATGGLRGGNTNTALAQFGSGLFAQLVQQQLGNLGGLVQTGSGTASNLGSLGQANANAQSNIFGNIGNANATAAAAPYAAFQGILNQIGAAAQPGGAISSATAAKTAPSVINNLSGFRW